MTSPISRRFSRPALAVAAATAATALAFGQPFIPTAAAAEEADPASDHLILDYGFEDLGDGTTVTDSSGNARNGVLANPGAAELVDRPDGGKALQLSGGAAGSTTSPYVTLPAGVFAGLTATSISTWIRWDGGAPFQWAYCVGKDADSAAFYTPRFDGVNVARSSVKPSTGGAEIGASGQSALPADEWHQITTTIDRDRVVYYLDGLEVSRTNVGVDVATALYGESSANSGYLGQPFWTGAHPFFAGTLDDFQVYDTALTPAQVAELAGDAIPDLVDILDTATTARTDVGTAPVLPTGVNASYSDGQNRLAPVTWEAIDPARYAQRGVFTVNGTVDGDGREVTATVRVTTPNELSIDVGQETGDFMGGASGTLYGLYGPGLPSNNLIDGIKLRTVATKAQDGPQHPGADALEIVKGLADSSDGDVYIYMTDTYRGFPYEVPGTTGPEKEADFAARIATQVDQVLELPAEYQDNVVFVPFNEPEGNMYGDGAQSFYGTSWLNDPTAYFANWDAMYRLIKGKMPEARIAGPNTSILFSQVRGFLEHTVASDTVPDVITWHELSDPASIRRSVATYRTWEQEIFAGTERAGVELPINLNEYAFNYHTSVPAQMIQWIAALEDTKVDGDIAYWNIDGNLSDSAVQANRANGQWWLLNSYGNMTGKTVLVTPPSPDQSYTLQGVATHDAAKQQVKALFGGGAGGPQNVFFDRLPSDIGDSAHVLIREIRWTGQIADSSEPQTIAEFDSPVADGSLALAFGSGDLPGLGAESAYEVIVTPGVDTTSASTPAVSWRGTYEAEAATHTGAPYYLNGPEGTPQNVGGFYTSGTRNVGGIETDSTLALDFAVEVPVAGTYDLTMLANAYNKEARNLDQGPVNMFIRVNGAAEQEVHANLGYKWVVWDRTDTTVDLQAGANTITIAAQNTDRTKGTSGAAIIDKIDLTLANPGHVPVYEAENAVLEGASTDYSQAGVSGSGTAQLSEGQSAVFWIYNEDDSEKILDVKTLGGGTAAVKVNGQRIADVSDSAAVPAFLVGGVNRVEIVGSSGTLALDRIAVGAGTGVFATQVIEAESGVLSGAATISDLSLASAGKAVTAVGGAPGNGNTLQTSVTVEEAGSYAMTIRYSNEEQSPASHYNPDPVARRADISVNGGALQKVLFPQSFHQNQFWDLTVQVELRAGENTITFASEEQPDFNGTSYISERYPTLGLRSVFAPNLDRFTFTSLFPSTVVPEPGDAAIRVDRATVQAGSTVTVSGTGFEADESIELVLNSDPVTLGTVTADDSGAFRTTVTVPSSVPAGAHTLVATGAGSAREASIALTVTAAGSGGGSSDGPGTGAGAGGSGSERAGGLASTGFGGFGALLAGAMALAAGAALIARARERRA